MIYELIRSDRRTLAIQIDREGRLIVRAPKSCPVREIERFLESKKDWIEEHTERQISRLEAHPEPDEGEIARLISSAKELLPKRIEYYSAKMGVYPAGITVTGAKTRFGSCSGKNRLSFSWRLMQYPPEAIDYVVVHELAHIRHKNHGAEFYAFIASVLPDWRDRVKLLK